MSAIVHRHAPRLRRIEAVRAHRQLGDALDVWVPILASGDVDWRFFEERMAQGDEVWFYTCERPRGRHLNRFIDHPLLKTRLLHWMNWRLGTAGYLHWGYNFWPRDPFQQLLLGRPVPGDCFIAYPGQQGILDSIRFEAMRDGIEDFELLAALAGHDRTAADALCREMIPSRTEYVRDAPRFHAIRRRLLEAVAEAQTKR